MALIHDLILGNLPKHKHTPRGWRIFNSVCCHHRGHNKDTRHRGNLIFTENGNIGYHCFNCGFKTRFNGIDISKNFESFMIWLGIQSDSISQLKLSLLRDKIDGAENSEETSGIFIRNFKEVDLPKDAVTIESVLEWDTIPEDYLSVVNYINNRGAAIAANWDYYWSSNTKHDMNNRVIVPFYYDHKIVGWTARYAGVAQHGTPRYYNSILQPGYLFNNEVLDKHNRKYVLLVEGPFDAIAVDGVAVLGSELSKEQLAWLLQCDKEIVVVPDRQRKNQGLIDAALDNNWYVSFPEWEDNIKDCADASARYGRIYTLRSILESKTKSALQIKVKRQMFKG